VEQCGVVAFDWKWHKKEEDGCTILVSQSDQIYKKN
jgi:hypothetical protein